MFSNNITFINNTFWYLFIEKKLFSKWPNTPYKTFNIRKELYNFKSFSEYYEDLILYLLLFDIKKCFYIDVGAYDPVNVSVTKFFYSKGWRGINIEPQPGKIELFQKDRPNDINLQLAVGKEKGNITLYIDGQCTTTKKNILKKMWIKLLLKWIRWVTYVKHMFQKEHKLIFVK